jgi:hypothetical protein
MLKRANHQAHANAGSYCSTKNRSKILAYIEADKTTEDVFSGHGEHDKQERQCENRLDLMW